MAEPEPIGIPNRKQRTSEPPVVDVESGRTLLDLIAFEQDLEEVLGCSVQVLTDAGLSPYLQQRILAEAVL
jgi:predicted nucleotidyltransferase